MIGVDIIHIDRMKSFMDRFGEKGLYRFLSDEEIRLIKSPKCAAAFWALKEATAKALGCGIGSECSFKDITISTPAKNIPIISLSERTCKIFGVTEPHASISYDSAYAIAVVKLDKMVNKEIK